MDEILQRIKENRKKKGFTYDNMANELNTSPAAYRKIELNQTKLTVERLYQIANIIDTKIEDLLDIKADKFYKQDIKENGIGCQDIEHFYSENKEKSDKIESLYLGRIEDKNKIIADKDTLIAKLYEIIDKKLLD